VGLMAKAIIYLIQAALKPLRDAIYTTRTFIAWLAGDFDKMNEITQEYGNTLFKDQFASTFLEGLMKIGNAFDFIRSMVVAVLSPIDTLAGGFRRVGETFADLPFINLGEGDANINVTAATSGPGAIAGQLAGAAGAVAGRFAGGERSSMTVEQPIEITLNGDKLANFVIKVTGDNVRSIAAIQK